MISISATIPSYIQELVPLWFVLHMHDHADCISLADSGRN